jgi:hypothetical protein
MKMLRLAPRHADFFTPSQQKNKPRISQRGSAAAKEAGPLITRIKRELGEENL